MHTVGTHIRQLVDEVWRGRRTRNHGGRDHGCDAALPGSASDRHTGHRAVPRVQVRLRDLLHRAQLAACDSEQLKSRQTNLS